MVATAPARAIAATPGAVGYILPGIIVQAVDGRGQPAAPGADGAIRIRGPYNAKEYMGDPEESQKVFRDGWFYPGDIGSIGPDGLLIISGREKSVLSVGGHKVTPELIEDLLLSFDGVEQAGVFPVVNSVGLEEVHAAIVARAEVDERQLFLHCQQGLPDHLVPRRFIKVEALPRNDMGKINRARLPDVARQA
jgi:acyl-coenzyme A synthetase/AMP-(fatty) acid ligase